MKSATTMLLAIISLASVPTMGQTTLQEFRQSYPLPPIRSYTFLGTENSDHQLWGTTNRYDKPAIQYNGVIDGWFNPSTQVSWLGIAMTAGSYDVSLMDGYLPVVFYNYRKVGATSVTCEMTTFAVDNTNALGSIFIYVGLIQKSNGVTQAANYLRLPDNAPTDAAAFTNALQGIRDRWTQFFAQCTIPACDDPDVLNACKASIIRALITYTGKRPHYGVRSYGPNTVYGSSHGDGFAPTTIAMVDCLFDWGRAALAREYLKYYFDNLIDDSGTINYLQDAPPYISGSSISEYGQLLWLIRKCMGADGTSDWLDHLRPKVEAIRANLWTAQTNSPNGLIIGAPEADLRDWQDYWFHNNGWAWRGLSEVAPLLNHAGESGRLKLFHDTILNSIRAYTVTNVSPQFISPKAANISAFSIMPDGDLPSYTNIRFWFELMSCGILSTQQMNEIIGYRLGHNGEIAGLARCRRTGSTGAPWADNWMVAEYAASLCALGQTNEVHRLLFSYLTGNITRETAMAYEMVTTATNGVSNAHFTDYCAVAQLVAPRLLAWLNGNTVRFAATNSLDVSYYWDLNGMGGGAGAASPSGAWDGVATNWNTDPMGADGGTLSATTAISDDVVFCASTDATGAYTVSVTGTQNVRKLTFKDGDASLTGGVLNLAPTAYVVTEPARNAVIASGISGAGAFFIKSGSGTLTLTGTNTFTGQISLEEGAIEIGEAGQLGGGTYSSAVANAGVLIHSGSATQTVSGPITGTGSLRKTGSGLLLLSPVSIAASNTYSGGTWVQAGVLGLTTTSGGGVNALPGNVYVDATGTVRLYQPNAIATGAAILLDGGTLDLNGYRDYFSSLTLSNGASVIGTGMSCWFILNDPAGPITAVGSGDAGTISANIAIASQWGTTSGNRTQTVNVAAGAALSISGAIADYREDSAQIGSLLKTGDGTLVLSGTNTYTGPTIVSNGTLMVNGVIGTGGVTVNNSATLGGTGVLHGVVTVNGTLASGNSVGTLTVSNNLVLAGSAVLAYELGAASDHTVVSGNLTLAGTLNIADAGKFDVGTYTLFTYAGNLTNNGLCIGVKPDSSLVYTLDTSTAGQVKLVVQYLPFVAWQFQYFGCTNCPQALADADPLGKGMNNTNQFLVGLNPTNSASMFRMGSVTRDSNGCFTVTWSSVGGKTYRVQYSNGDRLGGYTSVFTDVILDFPDTNPDGTPGTLGFIDDFTLIGAPPAGNRYYRVRLKLE